ncbi:immunoglobulin i-set domain-containing protein [Ditylenchus destructor]|nr:immunoglobulin i-set domain-containing protein [Ditylenchus destructor]
MEVALGKPITLNCEVGNPDGKTSITWLFNNSTSLPINANPSSISSSAAGSSRLLITDANQQNHGEYACLVRNSVGESTKHFDVGVLVPPTFVAEVYEEKMKVIVGQVQELHCPISEGNPTPAIEWLVNGRPISQSVERVNADGSDRQDGAPAENTVLDGGQRLAVMARDSARVHYTCVATNKAGTTSRDYFVQLISPPKMAAPNLEEDRPSSVDVFEGNSVTFECPIATPAMDSLIIKWLHGGTEIQADNPKYVISLDKTRLVVVNVQHHDESAFAFPPLIEGSTLEEVTVIEGEELDLQCVFNGIPIPKVVWTKDDQALNDNARLLNDDKFLYIDEALGADAGFYMCDVSNSAGKARKTFDVKVIVKPEVIESEEVLERETALGHPVSFECPVKPNVDAEIVWSRQGIPLHSKDEGVQVLDNGRRLMLVKPVVEDAGLFSCLASNRAGESKKDFQLNLLLAPRILSKGGEFKVIENSSLILSCESDGSPTPSIEWTKNGRALSSGEESAPIQLLSEKQQLKIVEATAQHRGTYACSVHNKVGRAGLTFQVDVVIRPVLALDDAQRKSVEVVEGEPVSLSCPLKQQDNFDGEILWQRDSEPINIDMNKFSTVHLNTKLMLLRSEKSDAGNYACIVRNAAGESRADFQLEVLTKPVILVFEKDKNRTVIEGHGFSLQCPSTGRPEPTIVWFKNGDRLLPENVTNKVLDSVIEGSELKVSRAGVGHAGRYSCEATNRAGTAEQDIQVEIMTPSRIQRDNLTSEVSGELGHRTSIACPAFGHPSPQITWLKGNKPIDELKDVYFASNRQRLHFDHADKYTCIAKNIAGEDKHDFFVTLLEEPTINITNIAAEVQINVGRTVTLVCPVSGSPEPSVSWLKDGHNFDPSLEEKVRLMSGGRQLQIANAQTADSGRFTCLATNQVGAADLDFFLTVIDAPVISEPEIEAVLVVLNKPSELACELVRGTEPVNIEWHRGGRPINLENDIDKAFVQISERGRKLHLLSAQRAHATRWACIAKNSAGEDRKIFDVQVNVPVTINDSASSPPIMSVMPGDQFRLDCIVDGVPQPEIRWLKDDQPLSLSDFVVLTNSSQTVWVRRANHTNDGRYQCHAENVLGNVSRNFIVKITGPPMLDLGPNGQPVEDLNLLVGDHSVLKCQALNSGGSTPIELTTSWLIDGRPVQEGQISPSITLDNSKIVIHSARLSDNGEYTCIVKNDAGQAQKKYVVNILERPHFMDTSNTHYSVIEGGSVALDCLVTGTPRPKITWTKVDIFYIKSCLFYILMYNIQIKVNKPIKKEKQLHL